MRVTDESKKDPCNARHVVLRQMRDASRTYVYVIKQEYTCKYETWFLVVQYSMS